MTQHNDYPPLSDRFLNADLTRKPGFVNDHQQWLIEQQMKGGETILIEAAPRIIPSTGLDFPTRSTFHLEASPEDLLTVVEAAEAQSETMYCQQTGHDDKIHQAIARLLAPRTPTQLRVMVRGEGTATPE